MFAATAVLASLFLAPVLAHDHTVTTITLDGAALGPFSTECFDYTYFRVQFPFACKDLNVTVFPTNGEPDTYVSRGITSDFSYPTKDSLSWAAFQTGDYNVFISHWDPESSPGYYDIAVYNDCTKKNTVATYKISATSSDLDNKDDVLLHPELLVGGILPAQGYKYYRFCVPECADTYYEIHSCTDPAVCPEHYSYPELLVSRTDKTPRVSDYSYKLATWKRSFFVNSTDPSARDANGFVSGSYYLGAFGWCTPQQFVKNNATDGPCAYAENIPFNITLLSYTRNDADCKAPITIPDDTKYPLIVPNQLNYGYVNCGEYFYYKLALSDPCVDVNFYMLTTSNPNSDVAEFSVGKYPNIKPKFQNLQWTSYSNKVQNFTILSDDPALPGGYNCGPNKNELCYLYVGIYGYCTTDAKTAQYEMQISVTPSSGLSAASAKQQKVSANGVNYYPFCVGSNISTAAVLLSQRDSCNCPHNYTDLQMSVSRSNKRASLSDRVWRLDDAASAFSIPLSVSDPFVRPGEYYLAVYGQCVPDKQCTDQCSCGPCSALETSSFAVSISNASASEIYLSAKKSPYTACPVPLTPDTCSNVCLLESKQPSASPTSASPTSSTASPSVSPTSSTASPTSTPVKQPSESNSNSNGELSAGDGAGIAIGAMVVFLLIVFLVYFLFFRSAGRGSRPSNASDRELVGNTKL